jgi:myosin heavy subunit
MLSDAISLWKSARQTVGGAVNSMTSALEQLDASGTEDIAQELEVYKDQLADAQMQHFELSKQMRLLLAEKDAEIKVLREKSASDNNGDESSIIEQTRIEMEKSKFEKEALSQNLEEMESKMKIVTRERNESKVTLTKLSKLEKQYSNLMRDYKALSTESNKMLSQKAETIDNLVAEYSHLASETEVRSEMDEKRLTEVMKENEVLSTKLHVMELNITELADKNSNGNEAIANNINGTGMTPAQFEELSAARVSILNLEFEVKEKQKLIGKSSSYHIAFCLNYCDSRDDGRYTNRISTHSFLGSYLSIYLSIYQSYSRPSFWFPSLSH